MRDQKPSPKDKNPKPETPPIAQQEKEIGGFKDSGLAEPTRFGDWEVKGRCSDF